MKKIIYSVFLIVIMSMTMLVSSAADDYEITVSSDSLGVAVDSRAQLSAEVEGLRLQPRITWRSSDESIAKVNAAGVVTGIGEGEADIIATAIVDGETVSTTYPVRVESEGKIVNTLLSKVPVISYRFDKNYGGFYYNDDKASWQTLFGFSKFYDYMAPISDMEYDHIRAFYTYDGQDFLMEFWKGHYGGFIGCELGLYHRDAQGLGKDTFDFYATAAEKYWPTMDMAFYRQVNEGDAPEDYVLEFKRPVDRYWWCTGFIPGELRNLRPADELRVEATMTFIDQEMADCTAKAMEEAGFKPCTDVADLGLDEFCQNGTSITFTWQNLTESQIIPGAFGEMISKIVAAIGAFFSDVAGPLMDKLLNT